MGRFLCFLIRTQRSPVPGFPVPLHVEVLTALESLLEALQSKDEEVIGVSIHNAIWRSLSYPSREFQRDDRLCPYSRFLLTTCVRDEEGHFLSPVAITPTISQMQWCFRATACSQILRIQDSGQGDDDIEVYTNYIERWLTDGKKSSFTCLRQYQALFSTLAGLVSGPPRIMWDSTKTILSLDTNPIPVLRVKQAAFDVAVRLEELIHNLCDGMDTRDLFALIDRRLDSRAANCDQWFMDSPRNVENGYSFLTDPRNELAPFRNSLMRYFCRGTKYFETVDCKVVFKSGAWPRPLLQPDLILEQAPLTKCSTWST